MLTAKSARGWKHEVAISIWVLGPFLAAIFAPIYGGISRLNLIVFAVGYVLPGLGITVGFHRMLTHESFKAKPFVRAALLIFGSSAVQGAPIHWAGIHREHHKEVEGPNDPHSPYAYGTGFKNIVRGLWHAHMGWMFEGKSIDAQLVTGLREDPLVVRIDRFWYGFVVIRFLLPFGVGYPIGGLDAAIGATLWGGAAAFLTLHSTFSVNSVCHMFGSRPYKTPGLPTNFFWLALPTFGEAFHNAHHAFQKSAHHGMTRLERAVDVSWWVIWTLDKLGLAWDVNVTLPGKIAARRNPEHKPGRLLS